MVCGVQIAAEEELLTGETLTKRTFPSPLVTVTSLTGTIFVEFNEDDEVEMEDAGEEGNDASLVFEVLIPLPFTFLSSLRSLNKKHKQHF